MKNPDNTDRLFLIGCPLVVFLAGGFLTALFVYRDHMLRTIDLVDREIWPQKLVDLIAESSTGGDPIDDIDVRRRDFSNCIWRIGASKSRLEIHEKYFELTNVPPGDVKHQRILMNIPYAWEVPTENVDIYANPVGLPGAADGETEFVLLHDKAKEVLYFYFYRNF